jgi:hypothetical protein
MSSSISTETILNLSADVVFDCMADEQATVVSARAAEENFNMRAKHDDVMVIGAMMARMTR